VGEHRQTIAISEFITRYLFRRQSALIIVCRCRCF